MGTKVLHAVPEVQWTAVLSTDTPPVSQNQPCLLPGEDMFPAGPSLAFATPLALHHSTLVCSRLDFILDTSPRPISHHTLITLVYSGPRISYTLPLFVGLFVGDFNRMGSFSVLRPYT